MLVSDSIKVYDTIELLKEQFNTSDWYLIKEEQSIFPHAKDIICRVCRYMYANVTNAITKRTPKGLVFNYQIPFNVFDGLDVFFEGIDLKITFFMMFDDNQRKAIDFSEFSNYKANGSWLTPDNKLFSPEILISYKCPRHRQYYAVIEPLTHELMHAYEDYCRLLHKAPPLANLVKQPLYNNVAKILQNPNTSKICKAIADIFYMGIKSEQNAFVAEVHAQIVNSFKPDEGPETYNIPFILRKLPLYDNLKNLNQDIDFLRYPDSQEERMEIQNCISQITGKNFENFEKAIFYLIDYNNRMQENMLKKAVRIIRKYKEEKGVYQIYQRQDPEAYFRERDNAKGFNDFEGAFDDFYKRISKH